MIDSLIWILVGAFIGWHVPQPSWAAIIKNKVMDDMANHA
jgi:hypothetical protein